MAFLLESRPGDILEAQLASVPDENHARMGCWSPNDPEIGENPIALLAVLGEAELGMVNLEKGFRTNFPASILKQTEAEKSGQHKNTQRAVMLHTHVKAVATRALSSTGSKWT